MFPGPVGALADGGGEARRRAPPQRVAGGGRSADLRRLKDDKAHQRGWCNRALLPAVGGGRRKLVKVPENGDTGLLMMPVRRRMRSRSRVDLPNDSEQECQPPVRERTWQSSVWPAAALVTKAQEWAGPGYGPSKSMEVVLGGVTKEVNGKKREVVMITDVTTGRQTIKMRFKPGEKAEKERLAAMNAQRQPSGRERTSRSRDRRGSQSHHRLRKGRTRSSKGVQTGESAIEKYVTN